MFDVLSVMLGALLTGTGIPSHRWEEETPASVRLDLLQLAQALQGTSDARLAGCPVLISVQSGRDRGHVAGEPAVVVREHPQPDVDLALPSIEP
jgi:hypothetical protein